MDIKCFVPIVQECAKGALWLICFEIGKECGKKFRRWNAGRRSIEIETPSNRASTNELDYFVGGDGNKYDAKITANDEAKTIVIDIFPIEE